MTLRSEVSAWLRGEPCNEEAARRQLVEYLTLIKHSVGEATEYAHNRATALAEDHSRPELHPKAMGVLEVARALQTLHNKLDVWWLK